MFPETPIIKNIKFVFLYEKSKINICFSDEEINILLNYMNKKEYENKKNLEI